MKEVRNSVASRSLGLRPSTFCVNLLFVVTTHSVETVTLWFSKTKAAINLKIGSLFLPGQTQFNPEILASNSSFLKRVSLACHRRASESVLPESPNNWNWNFFSKQPFLQETVLRLKLAHREMHIPWQKL